MIFARDLDENEKVVVIVRKHWLVFFLHVVLFATVGLLPLVAYSFIPPFALEALKQLVPGSVALFAYLLLLLLLWLLVFIDFTTYHLDVWIVTNRRIVGINQKTLFARDTTTLMLEKIQDATVEVRGLLATLFNYGTLIVHTAGENPDITITYAINPQKAKDKILEMERMASGRRGASDGIT